MKLIQKKLKMRYLILALFLMIQLPIAAKILTDQELQKMERLELSKPLDQLRPPPNELLPQESMSDLKSITIY